MVPNQDFELVIQDGTPAHNALLTVALNSGPPNEVTFPETSPSTECAGPITIHLAGVPTPPNFLVPATVADNSADYKVQTTTGHYAGRATFAGWLSANGFPPSGPASDETHAIYFNNADLKFGRSMHCRVTNTVTGAFACYVSNFGNVGTDDAVTALAQAYANTPIAATVAMEYDPAQAPNAVQFWAYLGNGNYLAKPQLDSQGPKPMPDICVACHYGSYGGAGQLVQNSNFLPFDVDSFLGDDGTPLPNTLGAGALRPTQEDFRVLNQLALSTSQGNSDYLALTNLWYKDGGHPQGVADAGATFHFGQGAAQLGTFPGHTALYDHVVQPACRTCHIVHDPTFDTWGSFTQMQPIANLIRGYACRTTPGQTSNFTMPHAEVPYKLFWQQSLSSTLASELAPTPPDCSN
jgi:hypothetical protein